MILPMVAILKLLLSSEKTVVKTKVVIFWCYHEILEFSYQNFDLSSWRSRPIIMKISNVHIKISTFRNISRPFLIMCRPFVIYPNISFFHNISRPFIIKSRLLAKMTFHKKRRIFNTFQSIFNEIIPYYRTSDWNSVLRFS